MPEGEKRVVQKHTRTGKDHNLTYVFPHFCSVAVNLAAGAKCFALHKRTALAPLTGIIGQLLTGGAEPPRLFIILCVIFFAIQVNHLIDNAHLPLPFLLYLFSYSGRQRRGAAFLLCLHFALLLCGKHEFSSVDGRHSEGDTVQLTDRLLRDHLVRLPAYDHFSVFQADQTV